MLRTLLNKRAKFGAKIIKRHGVTHFRCWVIFFSRTLYSCSLTADVIRKEARKIAAFMSFAYSILILGVFPLHQTAHVGVSDSREAKLFGRGIIFEVFQPA